MVIPVLLMLKNLIRNYVQIKFNMKRKLLKTWYLACEQLICERLQFSFKLLANVSPASVYQLGVLKLDSIQYMILQ